jgi:Transposase
MPETAYALYVGIDWGTVTHQVAVLDAQRVLRGERVIAHDAVALHAFTEWMMQLAGGEPARVAIALEVPRGAVVDTLLERGFHVFALNPKQLDRFRDRYTVAGAKDDRRDAFVLATALATDQPAFRALKPEDPLLIELREWSRVEDECARSGGASPVGCASSSTGFIRRRSPSVPPPTKHGFGRSWGSLPRPPRPSGSGAPPW